MVFFFKLFYWERIKRNTLKCPQVLDAFRKIIQGSFGESAAW